MLIWERGESYFVNFRQQKYISQFFLIILWLISLTKMVSLRFCGPKLSICCSILSVWGIIMLFLLALFLGVHSVAFAEDLAAPLEEYLEQPNFNLHMNNVYKQASFNCLIAACLYIVSLGISVWQYFLNRRASSTT